MGSTANEKYYNDNDDYDNDHRNFLSTGNETKLNQHDNHFAKSLFLQIFRFAMAQWFTGEWVNIVYWLGVKGAFNLLVQNTMITLLITWIYFVSISICGKATNHERFHKFFRILCFTTTAIAAHVSAFFWLLLFPYVVKNWDNNKAIKNWGMIAWHSVPFISLTIDCFWNKFHFKKKIFDLSNGLGLFISM